MISNFLYCAVDLGEKKRGSGGSDRRKRTEKHPFFHLLIVIPESSIKLQNYGNITENIRIYSFYQEDDLF